MLDRRMDRIRERRQKAAAYIHTERYSPIQDWAPAIAMAAVYFIFFAEIAAYRIGHRKMAALGLTYRKSCFRFSEQDRY